jgi:hypothetical protein|tara:strand:+ start:239 stop:415 length:177 start_codon:yes stop_codon:yes gene_type:complete
MNEKIQNQARVQQKLEEILDDLCRLTGRDIFVILPEDKAERIPYLKKEIIKTLEKVND